MKRIRRFISIILVLALALSGCSSNIKSEVTTEVQSTTELITVDTATVEDSEVDIEENDNQSYIPTEEPDFSSINLSDGRLLEYIESSVYAGLENEFSSDDYIIKEVQVKYISKEYIEEIEFNSKENVWFGHTLDELDTLFKDTPYVFTLGDDGNTVITPMEGYDDTYDRVLKNVAIGSGVILICITVSVVSGLVGAEPVSAVFAASAKGAAQMAFSTGAISAISAGLITGVATKDYDQAMAAAALAGSEAFKWGAIVGAITGGVAEFSAIKNAQNYTPRQAELNALKKYGGKEQISYMNGKEVKYGTPGATRPDIVVPVGDHLEAIEVKYYSLDSPSSLSTLKKELSREIKDRIVHMPEGTTQRVVLDVTGKGYSKGLVNEVVDMLSTFLSDIYQNIPIDVVGL